MQQFKKGISPAAVAFLLSPGQSASLFMRHARYIAEHFQGYIDFNKSCMTLYNEGGTQVKLYVHYQGRNEAFLTVKLKKGKERKFSEMKTFHYTARTKELMEYIDNIMK